MPTLRTAPPGGGSGWAHFSGIIHKPCSPAHPPARGAPLLPLWPPMSMLGPPCGVLRSPWHEAAPLTSMCCADQTFATCLLSEGRRLVTGAGPSPRASLALGARKSGRADSNARCRPHVRVPQIKLMGASGEGALSEL